MHGDSFEILKSDTTTEQIIEYIIMLLSNMTTHEKGQKHLFDVNEHIIVESVFGMMCYFNNNKIFDFVSNIMSNLACLSDGRKFMIDNKYIEAIVI